jgi:hypothetical protein
MVMNEQKRPNPNEWMDAAERFGEQLAQGFERVGERVVRALEHLDDLGGEDKPGSGVKVDDQRKAPARKIETLLKGDVFELEGKLYMRLGPIPEARRLDEIDAVDLKTGEVRMLARGLEVVQVQTRLTIEGPVR